MVCWLWSLSAVIGCHWPLSLAVSHIQQILHTQIAQTSTHSFVNSTSTFFPPFIPLLFPPTPFIRPDTSSAAYWQSVPNSLQWPVVAVATCAAIIASQALISGSFTIAQQVGAALVAWWVLGGGVC